MDEKKPTRNIYCDESRHLLCEDGPMALGALAVPAKAVYRHNRMIREIKKRHGIAGGFRELKWSKVSPAMLPLYREVVDYFFDQPDLTFRGILVPSKGLLDHARYGQTHNDWYYKMCFRLLERVIDTAAANRIYLDIKDTRGRVKLARLHDVLCNSEYDFDRSIIASVNNIPSHEVDLMCFPDLFAGAFAHHADGTGASAAKRELIEHMQKRSGMDWSRSSFPSERKFNYFIWNAKNG